MPTICVQHLISGRINLVLHGQYEWFDALGFVKKKKKKTLWYPSKIKNTSCSSALECDSKITTYLEKRMLFNEWSREMNIFGIWGFCCVLLWSPPFKNNRLPLKIDWITFKELWQTERVFLAVGLCATCLPAMMTNSFQQLTNNYYFFYQWVLSSYHTNHVENSFLINLSPPWSQIECLNLILRLFLYTVISL